MSILSVKNVSFSYPNSGQKAVDGVSFVIEKGSYTAIVGANGSGKSTLSRLICGLTPLQEGQIQTAPGIRIGLVFQSPKNQLVSSIVSRDTAFGPQSLGLKPSEVELRTIECLNIVDILEKAQESTYALSLGQTQKVAMSGMLAVWPDVLILDEALSMLDPSSRKNIFEFLRYWHKCGNTIIHITHNLAAVAEAENVLAMENGRVFFYGRCEKFLQSEENKIRIEGEPLPVVGKKVLLPENKKTFEFKNVSFSYKANDSQQNIYDGSISTKSGVKNIQFSLYKGTLTALTGHSGAGKSTILELGAGLLIPQSGSVFCESRPALVQQNCADALFESFAADDVAFGLEKQEIERTELKRRVLVAMEKANIPYEKFGERHITELSGGEQRRLAIAGMIILERPVIFFDEPTAGLDGKSRAKIMALLRSLADEGKTVLFSTHRNDEALAADRRIRVENGIVTEDSLLPSAEAAQNKAEQEKELPKMEPYSAATMLRGLRSASSFISGIHKSKSPIEKLPVALRIILFLALFVLSIAMRKIYVCAAVLIVSLFYCKLSGFKLKRLLKAMLKILPFLLFFSIFQLIFRAPLPDEIQFTTWKWFTITPSKLLFCLASILRTYSSLALISGFFVSTPEYDLIDGLKLLLHPLELIKIPVKYFILIMEIIFRFIPLLTDEAVSIVKTQIVRGGLGEAKGVMGKIKAVIPLIVPLIIQTIKRSEALADAITMRGFK